MTAVLLIIHLLIAIALVVLVLLQRSEGGALGIGGGGGGGGGLFSSRGVGNILTRSTAILAAAFFATSIILTILAQRGTVPVSPFDNVEQPAGSGESTPAGDGGGVLPQLPPMSGGDDAGSDEPQVPVSE